MKYNERKTRSDGYDCKKAAQYFKYNNDSRARCRDGFGRHYLPRHCVADPEPLELLSYGVDQISRGNLDYRLEYSNDDEFLPVCTAFNGMAERLERWLAATKRTEKSFCSTGSTESLILSPNIKSAAGSFYTLCG